MCIHLEKGSEGGIRRGDAKRGSAGARTRLRDRAAGRSGGGREEDKSKKLSFHVRAANLSSHEDDAEQQRRSDVDDDNFFLFWHCHMTLFSAFPLKAEEWPSQGTQTWR